MFKGLETAPARLKRIKIERYTNLAQGLHWVTALLMFAVIVIAWVMVSMAKDNPYRDMMFTSHKSVGVTILALTVLRLIWRAGHRAPALPANVAPWEAGLAKVSHWLLYAVLVIMPVSGYVLTATSTYPLSFFGLFDLPHLPTNKALSHAAAEVHEVTQWAVYGLIALHIFATLWHTIAYRDGTLERMLPEQTN